MSSEIAERLSRQTRLIVSRFEERVESVVGRKDLLQLTVGLDSKTAGGSGKGHHGHRHLTRHSPIRSA